MIRRLAPLLAAAVMAAAAPAPAMAQDAGVSVADARAWLIDKGGVVAEPVAQPGSITLRVSDSLPWTLTFYGCQTLCADAQYTSTFTGPAVTLDWVNRWNRENRYLKAHFVAPAAAGGEGAAVVSYDVVLTGTGPDQLAQTTVVWKQLQANFGRALQQASAQ
jgi:hypothetical protein